MGRSLQNTMINIGINGACDEAMYQVKNIGSLTKICHLNPLIWFPVYGVTIDRHGYRRARKHGGRCWSWQRRPRPPSSMFSRLYGHSGYGCLWIWYSIWLWYFYPTPSQWRTGREGVPLQAFNVVHAFFPPTLGLIWPFTTPARPCNTTQPLHKMTQKSSWDLTLRNLKTLRLMLVWEMEASADLQHAF